MNYFRRETISRPIVRCGGLKVQAVVSESKENGQNPSDRMSVHEIWGNHSELHENNCGSAATTKQKLIQKKETHPVGATRAEVWAIGIYSSPEIPDEKDSISDIPLGYLTYFAKRWRGNFVESSSQWNM